MTTQYDVTIEGYRPLIMHNGRLANPLDEHTKALKAATKKRQKTDEDFIEAARIEFIGSLYFDANEGPVLPCDNLQSCMVEGARTRKNGQVFESQVEILPGDLGPGDTFGYRLDYKGPRDAEGLWNDERFRLVKGAKVGMSRVMRTRPKFNRWSCTFKIEVADGGPPGEMIREALEDAGRIKGICDWTPRYGRFRVAAFVEVPS